MSNTMQPLTEQQAERLAELLTEVGFAHRPAQTNLVWHVVPDDEAPPHEVYESCLHQLWQDETDQQTADAIAKARAQAHKQEVQP
jgi:flagellar biosynthesis/type III secretory pathway protein FliH